MQVLGLRFAAKGERSRLKDNSKGKKRMHGAVLAILAGSTDPQPPAHTLTRSLRARCWTAVIGLVVDGLELFLVNSQPKRVLS
jgi:hypothetical protein